jgi:hypothetical protein
MEPAFRHLCHVYEGSPSLQLPAVVAVMRHKMEQNHRCLYMHTRSMVFEMQSYLAAAGLDLAYETDRAGLVFLSEQQHLTSDGRFDIERMLHNLKNALDDALNDGFEGLWITGDMTWEAGPERDFSRHLEYEWRVDEFFRDHPESGAICQYHADTLPRAILRQSLLCHPSIFVSETGSLANPYFLHPAFLTHEPSEIPELEGAVNRLLQQNDIA